MLNVIYAVMETMVEFIERRDNTKGGHISRTSSYMNILIEGMIKDKIYSEQTALWNIDQMIASAQLHDVGKVAIDEMILRKPGRLTDTEFEIIKRHTLLGGEVIKEIQSKTGQNEFLENAHLFAVYHHEKWDGTGYPYGLAGEKIPLQGRLMAIADVYDALISEKPYKKPFSHEETVKIINDAKGSCFDPLLTDIFIAVSDKLAGVEK